MPVKYIHPQSQASLFRVAEDFMNGKTGYSYDYPPWVIVGNVFASLTFTGNTSWEYVVTDLYKKGQKHFIVLAGRHGAIDGSGFPGREGDDSAVHPSRDRETATGLQSGRPDLQITVEDVQDTAKSTILELQSLIKSSVEKNAVVILAWCHSFHSMKSHIDATSDKDQIATAQTKIADTFGLDWKYLESFPQLSPVRAIEAEASRVNA